MDVREHQSQAARIEALVQEVTAFPDAQMRLKIEELLGALLNMYGEGLARVLEMIEQADAAGKALVEMLAKDELVGSLLLLHGLHPLDLETRIHQALDRVPMSLQERGVSIKLTSIENGVAYLWLTSNRQGCSSSLNALKQTIEQIIYSAAPDLDEIRFEERPGAIPVKFVPLRRSQKKTGADEQVEESQSQKQSLSGISGRK